MYTRQRGRGRGRGSGAPVVHDVAEAGKSNLKDTSTEQNQASPADPGIESEETHKCGMCNLVLENNGIGCDRCSAWFHPSEMCLGLSRASIHLIVESEDSDALLYLCTACRLKPGTGAWTKSKGRHRTSSKTEDDSQIQLINQLFQTVRGLCSEVANLSQKISSALNNSQDMATSGRSEPLTAPSYSEVASSPQPLARAHPAPPSSQTAQLQTAHGENQYRTMVRQEVREIQEREKRRHSIVIRGLSSSTSAGIVSEFSDMTTTMMGSQITLTEVVKIPNNPGLWRAKILNPENRKLVLDRAKHLKGSQFDHVFVRRDLTYAQRMELRLRRENLAHESKAAEPARPAASQPTEPAHPAASQPAEPARPAASQPAEPARPAASQPAEPARPAAPQSVSHSGESEDPTSTLAEQHSTAASEKVQPLTQPDPSSGANGGTPNVTDKSVSNTPLN